MVLLSVVKPSMYLERTKAYMITCIWLEVIIRLRCDLPDVSLGMQKSLRPRWYRVENGLHLLQGGGILRGWKKKEMKANQFHVLDLDDIFCKIYRQTLVLFSRKEEIKHDDSAQWDQSDQFSTIFITISFMLRRD